MARSSADGGLALCLRGLLAHSELGDHAQRLILTLPARTAAVASHREFVSPGEKLDSTCLVVEGLIARFSQTGEGARQIISLHLPGDLVDLPSLFRPVASRGMTALTASVVARLPHHELRELVRAHPAIGNAFLRACLIDMSTIEQWLLNIGRHNAYARMAHFFCEMALRYRDKGLSDGDSFALPMTQEQMGDALAMTPIHINRTLKLLRQEKLIDTGRNLVTILDPEALALVGEFDPGYLRFGRRDTAAPEPGAQRRLASA